jgi:hypothetical protein
MGGFYSLYFTRALKQEIQGMVVQSFISALIGGNYEQSGSKHVPKWRCTTDRFQLGFRRSVRGKYKLKAALPPFSRVFHNSANNRMHADSKKRHISFLVVRFAVDDVCVRAKEQ